MLNVNQSKQWDFWIDRGGTFTDVVARDPYGSIHIDKLLSDNLSKYKDAGIEAIKRFLDEFGIKNKTRVLDPPKPGKDSGDQNIHFQRLSFK